MKTETFKQLTKKFDWINHHIKDGIFPFEEVSKDTGYRLFHFDRYISSEDAIKKMKEEGYKAATFSELLHWKDWNEKDWVVALGSVGEVGGSRRVPCLDGDASERRLYLYWWVRDWNAGCRFLGTKLSSDSRSSENSALVPFDSLNLKSAIKICKENGLKVIKEI